MQYQDLLKQEISLDSITSDSRSVKTGSIFVAIQGENHDGHDYVQEAISNGADWVIVEKNINSDKAIKVPNTRQALAELAHQVSNCAADNFTVYGITGTNGKTTINWMIANALEQLGVKTLRFGTLGTYAQDLIDHESLTTDDSLSIHSAFSKAWQNNISHAVMEVSSHGLEQDRVSAINFDVAIYTNLTRDHLDYHKNFENYYLAKKKLFELLERSNKKNKTAIINIDCEYGRRLLSELGDVKKITIGTKSQAELGFKILSQDYAGSTIEFVYTNTSFQINSVFIGKHNAFNLACAFASLIASSSFELEDIATALSNISPVPGRLEGVHGKDFGVFVDYAHTPDALENVLTAVKPLVKNKLWVVFGCGGDRDKAKRPEMGEIAMRLADEVVVTSDNPRTEDPQQIIDDILVSCKPSIVKADRKEAIIETLNSAKTGDLVLIAGKGHEDYQILGKEKIHFSDQEVVKNYF